MGDADRGFGLVDMLTAGTLRPIGIDPDLVPVELDVRIVDFDLRQWPARNGVWVSLMVSGSPFNAYRVSWQFDQSEAYGAYLPPVGTTLPASGTTGSAPRHCATSTCVARTCVDSISRMLT